MSNTKYICACCGRGIPPGQCGCAGGPVPDEDGKTTDDGVAEVEVVSWPPKKKRSGE